MSDHSRAIVPIEAWSFSSPDLMLHGYDVDIGLLAESLLYYETVYLNVANQPQFATVIDWFVRQNRLDTFLSLVSQGIIQIFDFSFGTTAIRLGASSKYKLVNIQDEAQKKQNSFEQRFLYHQAVQSVLPQNLKRKTFYSAFRGKVVEAKADDFGSAIENAIEDHADPRRLKLILQSFVDELYNIKNLGHPPEIKTIIKESADKSEREITWNININDLSKLAGPRLNISRGTPLTAGGMSNRFLWAAAQLNCDLFLAQPIGVLVGDKLFEAEKRILATSETIESLERLVEFPDVRNLINFGKMNIDEVLIIRKNSGRFREWLKIEGERDRDAIIAYHNEVAKESGFTRVGKKMFSAFGVIGGAAIGSLAENKLPGVSGAVVGASVAAGIGYLSDIVSKMKKDWKPVVFGSWMKERIEKMIEEME